VFVTVLLLDSREQTCGSQKSGSRKGLREYNERLRRVIRNSKSVWRGSAGVNLWLIRLPLLASLRIEFVHLFGEGAATGSWSGST